MRYAVSSEEEVWVRACAKFFAEHGDYDWYQVPKDQAFAEIMMHTKGCGNPHKIRTRVYNLYASVGIRG